MHLTENLIVSIQVYIVMHLHVYNLVSNVSHFIFITNQFLINKNMCYDQIKKVTFT